MKLAVGVCTREVFWLNAVWIDILDIFLVLCAKIQQKIQNDLDYWWILQFNLKKKKGEKECISVLFLS